MKTQQTPTLAEVDPATPCSDSCKRCYTTRSSAHGSDYVPLSTPERFEMTLAEAEADVLHWRAFADTVGGDAIVVRDPNAQGDSQSPAKNL